jgi:hypothetical protein
MSSLETAKRKLTCPPGEIEPYPLVDLPMDIHDPLWKSIQQAFVLSLSEVAALKNFVSLKQIGELRCCSRILVFNLLLRIRNGSCVE